MGDSGEPVNTIEPILDLQAIADRVLELSVKAHFDALHKAGFTIGYDRISDLSKRVVSNQLRDHVEAAVAITYEVMSEHLIPVQRDLLMALAEPSPCTFDHHGGCQTHGVLDLEPGQQCPQAVLAEILDDHA
jgi:hypothetical protein